MFYKLFSFSLPIAQSTCSYGAISDTLRRNTEVLDVLTNTRFNTYRSFKKYVGIFGQEFDTLASSPQSNVLDLSAGDCCALFDVYQKHPNRSGHLHGYGFAFPQHSLFTIAYYENFKNDIFKFISGDFLTCTISPHVYNVIIDYFGVLSYNMAPHIAFQKIHEGLQVGGKVFIKHSKYVHILDSTAVPSTSSESTASYLLDWVKEKIGDATMTGFVILSPSEDRVLCLQKTDTPFSMPSTKVLYAGYPNGNHEGYPYIQLQEVVRDADC